MAPRIVISPDETFETSAPLWVLRHPTLSAYGLMAAVVVVLIVVAMYVMGWVKYMDEPTAKAPSAAAAGTGTGGTPAPADAASSVSTESVLKLIETINKAT